MSQNKFSICSEIFQNWDLEKTMKYVADVGYDAIEIAPFTLANSVKEIGAPRRQEIKGMADRNGIDITGIHWVLIKPEGLYINHTDASIRKQTSDYFVELTKFGSDIGGKYMIVGSPKQRNLMPGVEKQQAWEWALDTFKDAVKVAEDREFTICFEPLAPAETNFINTAAEAIEFVQELDSPAFQIILDVKAMSSESKSIPEIIRDSKSHLGYFHANDANLKGPGFGQVDFKPIAKALKEVGYKGYVSVEVFSFEEGPEVIATQSLEYLKSVFC